jgi:hypothetical protein
VREVIPGVAGLTTVLAHRAPLAFAEVRAPLFPRHAPLPSLVQAFLLGGIGNLYAKLVRQCSPPVRQHGSGVLPDPRPRGIAVSGPIGLIIAAVVGAIILIAILRLIKRA